MSYVGSGVEFAENAVLQKKGDNFCGRFFRTTDLGVLKQIAAKHLSKEFNLVPATQAHDYSGRTLDDFLSDNLPRLTAYHGGR